MLLKRADICASAQACFDDNGFEGLCSEESICGKYLEQATPRVRFHVGSRIDFRDEA